MKYPRLLILTVIGFWTCRAVADPRSHFELRVYTATSNKLEGVLERFRDTVDPVRRRHGIRTLGYWSAPGTTNGGTFAYIMTAASKEELRRQDEEFGRDPDFQQGYAASNAKHGKTVDKILALPLAVDPTAKFDFKSAQPGRAFRMAATHVVIQALQMGYQGGRHVRTPRQMPSCRFH